MDFGDFLIKYIELEIEVTELRVDMPFSHHYPNRKYTISQTHKFNTPIPLRDFRLRQLNLGKLKPPDNCPKDFYTLPSIEAVIGLDENYSSFQVCMISDDDYQSKDENKEHYYSAESCYWIDRSLTKINKDDKDSKYEKTTNKYGAIPQDEYVLFLKIGTGSTMTGYDSNRVNIPKCELISQSSFYDTEQDEEWKRLDEKYKEMDRQVEEENKKEYDKMMERMDRINNDPEYYKEFSKNISHLMGVLQTGGVKP